MIQASPADYAEYQPAQTWAAPMPFEDVVGNAVAPKVEAVFVHINHGRWIVDCPDCNGAQLACLADHRFMCNECANVAVDHLWRPVVWPAEHRGITEAIDSRADRKLQNYEPGETLAELLEQNAVLADETVVGGVVVRGLNSPPEYPDFTDHHHDYPAKVDLDEQYACADPACRHPEYGRDIKALRKSGVLR